MSDVKLLDASNTLAIDLTGVKLIEASAGTGKTYTICNLYCRYILNGTAVQNILLVTFTNAATDELKQRIRLRLKNLFDVLKSQQENQTDTFLALLLQQFNQQDEEQQQLWLNRLLLAIRSFDESSIHTINGFCQRMLGDYAFYSAQHYELNLLQDDRELWLSAIQDWWRINSYELNPSHYQLFIQALKNVNEVDKQSQLLRSDQFHMLLPEQFIGLDELYQQWDDGVKQLQRIKELWLEQKPALIDYFNSEGVFKKTGPHHPDKVNAHIQRLEAFFATDSCDVVFDSFGLLCKSQIDKDTYKPQIDQHELAKSELFYLADSLYKQQLDNIKQFKASALVQAQLFAEKHIETVKSQQHSLSYDDQMKRLHDALLQAEPHAQQDLANKIRQKFPVALIDEFQDTNAIQYALFKHLYYQQSKLSLMMIGDPKQAIYSFRGGDIFTYMQAKSDVGDQVYSLNQNWRSTAQLIAAVNQLFEQRDDTFIYAQSIPFEPVQAGGLNSAELSISGLKQSSLSLCNIEEGLNSDQSSNAINEFTANQISELINAGQKGQAMLGESAVKASDIAILVRNNKQAKAIAQSLKMRGVHSVSMGKDTVFKSDAAKGLALLLNGVAEHKDVQAVRNMLASHLLRMTPEAMSQIINQQPEWIAWQTKVNTLHAIWLQDGFISMFYSMLRLLGVNHQLAQFDDAERQMTNLLHCSEMIQQASKIHATPQALCQWLKAQIDDDSKSRSDEEELRLESEMALVKIVTVHKSKGLEYPIVFVPYLWKCRPVSATQTVYKYHNEQQQAVIDFALGSDSDKKQAYIHCDKERLAEDMRLLYVAMTRAQSKLYLVTGQVGRTASNRSALSFLLHPHQAASELNQQLADIKPLVKKQKLDLNHELETIALQSNGNIDYQCIDEEDIVMLDLQNPASDERLTAAEFSGDIHFDWQLSSFSGMTRDIHQQPHGGQLAATDDQIMNFKKGGEAGTFLHHILENLDFSGDVAKQVPRLFQQFAPRFNIDDESSEQITCDWMHEIVNTSLNEQGLTLAQLKPEHCLNELEFDFSLKHLNINALNRFLVERSGQTISTLSMADFRGMINGLIDLVFEHDGRFYIADYKSNFLGTQLNDYTPELLQSAIVARRYDLQYLLYSLALHRYLKVRLADYDYDTHFGGNYYLFIRAMRIKTGHQYGVFFDRPTKQEMNQLNEQIFTAASVNEHE